MTAISKRDKLYLECELRGIGEAIVEDARECSCEWDWTVDDLVDRMTRRTIAAVEELISRKDAKDAKKGDRL